ncbi:MAG TPA: hypothetical protein PKY30_09540, partial [Myxococcota bacterium]|nr:hypothetical protein [Myxococcota bacterium]
QGKRLKDAFSAAQHVVTAADPSLFSLYKLYEPEAAEELCFPPTPLPQVVLSSLPSETPTNQVVILLDAYGGTVDPYLARVPDRRADRKVLQLSTFLKDYGLRPLDHQSPPLSWELLAEATEALVKAALQAFPEQPKSYYIGGMRPMRLLLTWASVCRIGQGARCSFTRTPTRAGWTSISAFLPREAIFLRRPPAWSVTRWPMVWWGSIWGRWEVGFLQVRRAFSAVKVSIGRGWWH